MTTAIKKPIEMKKMKKMKKTAAPMKKMKTANPSLTRKTAVKKKEYTKLK